MVRLSSIVYYIKGQLLKFACIRYDEEGQRRQSAISFLQRWEYITSILIPRLRRDGSRRKAFLHIRVVAAKHQLLWAGL